ncbi:hypothetical protein [Pseudomonas triticifolii]|uniref:Uncharacterized protein n=1 Tax=Pseudomonas triticifolii TaxID=2762592 RepID=A0ABR7BCF2_9PSED|nr:hypothetical protein [Pseudomonas triticifolii]MBC3954848.1 hypothetical protein [Pseudomonas triticifolii]
MRVLSSGAEAVNVATQLDQKFMSREMSSFSGSLVKSVSARSTVDISGQALLKQRIFGIDCPERSAPVLGRSECGRMRPEAEFLTRDDRALLCDIYKWANGHGVDLAYVDDLAFELAEYRESDDGKLTLAHNQGKLYSAEGHRVFYSFTDKDAATAKRILQSKALETTRLDHGFIRFITNKDFGSIGHNNFDFMEKVISRFSASVTNDHPPGPEFSTFQSSKNSYIRSLSKEKYGLGNGDAREAGSDVELTKKSTKPKPITLESLRADLRQSLFQAMGVKSFSSLFALLFKDKR